MTTKTSGDYITNRAWLRDAIGDDELILCGVSALEYLQLFVGYINEKEIDVYSKNKGVYENINYHIVDTFEGIEVVRFGNVLCTSLNQTINDMLSDYDNMDELALTEAVSNYYHSNGKSFNGLEINPSNIKYFDIVKEAAIEYYCGG